MVEKLTENFSKFIVKDIDKVIKIQKWFRGYILRLKLLPLIMYIIKKYLELQAFRFSTQNEDGRINSCLDEPKVISWSRTGNSLIYTAS